MHFTAVILIICTVLAYTGQTFFSKLFSLTYKGPAGTATPVFASFYGLIVGLGTLIYNGFRYHPDTITLIFGVINGVALFFYNLSIINAARTGPYSFQSMMSSFGNILPPLVVNLAFWGDTLKPIKIIGVIVMLSAFILYNAKGFHFSDAKKGYGLWVALIFLTNGIYSVFVDAQTRLEAGALRGELITTAFLSSAIISIGYLLITQKGNVRPALTFTAKSAAAMCLSSVCAAVAINLLMVDLQYISSSVLFPVNSGSILILSTFLSFLVFKEKLDRNRILGVAMAVVSLVLVNLGR